MRRVLSRSTAVFAVALLAALLYACGGGGDNDFVSLPELSWNQGNWDSVSWAP